MSTEEDEGGGGFLEGIATRVGEVSVLNQGDKVGVQRDIEMSDELASPIAESVKSAREEIQDQQHQTEFDLYDAMVNLDPELSGAVRAMSQSASNYEITIPTDEPSDKDREALEDIKDLERRLKLPLMMTDILKKLITHGNDINKKVYNEEVGIQKLQSLPTNAVTIVDDPEDIGEDADETDDTFSGLIRQEEGDEADISEDSVNEVFSREIYVINEATEGVSHSTISPDNILHFSIDERSNWFEDSTGRETYGVWGQSRLQPLTFTIQTKYNTLTNKVAMDDKLLAREIYYIDTEALFGDISDREDRIKKAKAYARELKGEIENLGPDERPMLPEHVDVSVIGPEGKAIDQTPFVEQLNNSIAAALTFPMAGLGRGTTSVKAGEEISSLWAENNIRNLRQSVTYGIQEMFEDHLLLLHEDWRENDSDNLADMSLTDEVTVPTLEYEPFREEDRSEVVSQIKGLVSTQSITLAERRELFGLSTDDEHLEKVREEYGSGGVGPSPGDGVSSNDPDADGTGRGDIPEDSAPSQPQTDEVDE